MKKTDKLIEIARKAPSRYTNDDKAFIVRMSKEMGVEFTLRPECQDCYADQAKILVAKLHKEEAEKAPAKYVLKDGVDIIFRNIRVNKETLTDEMAEDILSRGFWKCYFEKMPS